MERLKRAFEDQLKAALLADGKVRVSTPIARGRLAPGEAFSPVDILRADKVVYENEAERWLMQQWLPPRRQLLEVQLALPDNKNRFADLCGRLAAEAVIPFVGAGMSRASGLPDWGGLLESLLEKSNCRKASLKALLRKGRYEAAADLLHQHAVPVAFDEKLNHVCRVEREKLAGPILLLPDLFQKLLITTNFDRVLEDVYAEEGSDIGQIFAGADVRSFQVKRDNTRPQLLKLHGSYDDPASRVFTSNEYAEAYKPGGPLITELQNAARNSTLLFLGASLGNDRTVAVLREMVRLTPIGTSHYSFMRFIADEKVRKKRERELAECRIFPIWFEPVPPKNQDGSPDFDLPVEALLVGMLLHQENKLFIRH